MGGDPRALRLLAVCDLSAEENGSTDSYRTGAGSVKRRRCNIPYKDVLARKMEQLLNEV